MTPQSFNDFEEIWFEDFEFQIRGGEHPTSVCLVAKELFTGRTISIWQDQLLEQTKPPFRIDRKVLHVSYFSTAEFSCYLALGWPLPAYQLDLWVEFRVFTNGKVPKKETALLKTLSYFGFNETTDEYKDVMRGLVLRGNWSEDEKEAILKYCESDVDALILLFEKMKEQIDLPRALFRGHYMKSVSRIESNGIPIDIDQLKKLQTHWDIIKCHLIKEIDTQFDVYSGLTFKEKKFSDYLKKENIDWPRTEKGRLILKDEVFQIMSIRFPQIIQLRNLRKTLSSLKTIDLPVGSDERNRSLISPFSSVTSRNQPSTTNFIFGLPSWMRHIIRPKQGKSLAYIDYSQQEIGIAASLSNDANMMTAYSSGDFYLTFAKMAGAVPQSATKESHDEKRNQFKECALGVSYGLGYQKLALKAGCTDYEAQELLKLHRKTFSVFWDWAEENIDQTMLGVKFQTCYGWPLLYGPNLSPRTLLNYPMQANGAEILRLACVLLQDHNIKICAPVHDALLIEAPTTQIYETAKLAQNLMQQASSMLLQNITLRTDIDFIHYPEHMVPTKGQEILDIVSQVLNEHSSNEPVTKKNRGCLQNTTPVQSNINSYEVNT